MTHPNGTLNRKLQGGLFGGGPDSFIGAVHRAAMVLDNRAALAAGNFASTRERSLLVAPSHDVPENRVYASTAEFFEHEAALGDGGVDFVSIATPNHTHYEIAKAAVEAGVNVICDKPMTFNLAQAEELMHLVEEEGVVFAVSHNYTGYPLVRQAREMIAAGEIGEIRAIRAHYTQGWLWNRLEATDQKQSAWRTDPERSGVAGCFGDIGTHAYNLGRYMTGLPSERLLFADLKTFVEGRALDDYGTATIQMANDARFQVTASQVSHGHENNLRIEIDGETGSLSWEQENPNGMWLRRQGTLTQLLTRDPNAGWMNASGKAACRLPGGHPEAFFEAFANVYRFAFDAMIARKNGEFDAENADTIYPNIYDGCEGMFFIEQCVVASRERTSLPMDYKFARERQFDASEV